MGDENRAAAYEGDPPEPPQPPAVGRRPRLTLVQAVGVPLLALLPILALFNFFGTTRGTVRAEDGPLEVEVVYPERFRYKMIHPLTVTVRNRGDAASADVTIRIDTSYLEHFSNVSFTPAPQRVTSDAYVFTVGDLAPGDARVLAGHVQAERYWGANGRITVDSESIGRVDIGVDSLVFP